MVGIIVGFVLSFLIIFAYEKKSADSLGFKPVNQRLTDFFLFLFAGLVLCAIYHYSTNALVNNRWLFNENFGAEQFFNGLWFVFKGVIFEELLFRGALLYIMINKTGAKPACIISAVCFGIYHWFSYGLLGNPFGMTIVFVMTGFFGWASALAFAKTKSLYLSIGMHLGWNLSNLVIFSNGPIGQQMLSKANGIKPDGVLSLLIFMFQVLALPLFTVWYLKRPQKN